MIIDETIYPAIADETLTIEQVCAAMLQVRDAIEILEQVAAEAIGGFDEDTSAEIETHARDQPPVEHSGSNG